MNRRWLLLPAIALLAAAVAVPVVMAQDGGEDDTVTAAALAGDTFTYQGSLSDGGELATGEFDFEFRLYDSAGDDGQVGTTLTVPNLDVEEGLFTVQLNFGPGVFQGEKRFLEVRVRPGDSSAGYQQLLPRQELTATPYALSLKPGAVVDGGDLSVTVVGADAGLLASNTAPSGVIPAVMAETSSTTANAMALFARINADSPGEFSAAIRAINNGTGANGIGIWGSQEGSGYGVYGQAPGGIGVFGQATGSFGGTGVRGEATAVDGIGVHALGSGDGGVALRLDDGGITVGSGQAAPAFAHSPATTCAGGSATPIDSPYTNSRPDALVLITATTSTALPAADASPAVYQVAYSGDNSGSGFSTANPVCPANRWVIYNVLGEPIPGGTSFVVLVLNR